MCCDTYTDTQCVHSKMENKINTTEVSWFAVVNALANLTTQYIIYPMQNIWCTLSHTHLHPTLYTVWAVKWMDSCAAVSADSSHYHEYLALNVRFMSKNRFNTIANECGWGREMPNKSSVKKLEQPTNNIFIWWEQKLRCGELSHFTEPEQSMASPIRCSLYLSF